MYQLSSNIIIQSNENEKYIVNTLVDKKFNSNDALIKILETLKESGPKSQNDLLHLMNKNTFFQLLNTGILIPSAIYKNEKDYLLSLFMFRAPECGFFHCKKTNFLELLFFERDAFVFFGVPFDDNSAMPGSRYGPNLLRTSSLATNFRSKKTENIFHIDHRRHVFSNFKAFDLGDLRPDSNDFSNIDVLQNVYKLIPENIIPIMIGGDHSYTYHAVKASHRKLAKPITLVQLDHHLDMSLASDNFNSDEIKIPKLNHANFISWLLKDIPSLDLYQVGVNSFQEIRTSNSSSSNYQNLNSLSNIITNTQILTNSIDNTLCRLPKNKNIYITLDVDVIQSSEMAATGYPGHFGVNLDKLLSILVYLCKKNVVIGLDIMEFGVSRRKEEHFPMSNRINSILLSILSEISEKKTNSTLEL